MKKRILSLVVTLCMLLTCIPAIVSAETVTASGSFDAATGLSWTVYDGTKLVISKTGDGTGKMPDYSTSNDKPWETYRSVIEEAVIEEGVVYIGTTALQEHGNLTTVTMADTVTSMGTSVFNSSTKITSIKLSENLASIPKSTFMSALALPEIIVPFKTQINADSFNRINNLNTIVKVYDGSAGHTWVLSSGVAGKTPEVQMTKSSKNTLNYEVLPAPEVLTASGDFAADTGLEWKVYNEKKLVISRKSDNGAYLGNGVMPDYGDSDEKPWEAYKSKITQIDIEEGVVHVGAAAFLGHSALTATTMANTVMTMGTSVFHSCSALASIKLSENLEKIPATTFLNASALKSVIVPFKTDLDERSFERAPIALVISVYQNSAGYDWASTGPEPGKTPLVRTNRAGDTDNYNYEVIPANKVTDEGSAYWIKGGNTLTIFGTGEIPDYTDLSTRPWNDMSSEVTSIVIADGITKIGAKAFEGFVNLKTVTMADSVTSMGSYAFSGCTSLTSAELSANLASLPEAVFNGATSLKEITVPSKTKIVADSFIGTSADITIYAYAGGAAYTENNSSLDYTDGNGTVRTCTQLTTESGTDGTTTWSYDFDARTLTIGGSGAMTNYTDTTYTMRAWHGYASYISKVIVGNKVTAIGDYALFNTMVNTLVFDSVSTVKRIGEYAFSNARLKEVELPESVEYVHNAAFRATNTNDNRATLKKFVINGIDTIVDNTCLLNQVNAVVYFKYASKATEVIKATDYVEYRLLDIDYLMENYDSASKTAKVINSTDSDKAVALVFVSYDDNKAISDTSIVNTTLTVGVNNISAGTDFIPTDDVNIFLWNDMGTLVPLSRTYKKNRVWMLGDSIMTNWRDSVYPQEGWGEAFKSLVTTDLEVINKAVAGYRAESIYKEIWADNTYNENVPAVLDELRAGDYVILSTLHNDYCHIADPNNDGYKAGLHTEYIETYKEYIQKFVDDCEAKGAKLILVVPPNRGSADNFHDNTVEVNGEAVVVGDYSAVIPAVAATNDVPCVNIHTWTMEQIAADNSFVDRVYLSKNYLNGLISSGALTEEELNIHGNNNVKNNRDDKTHLSIPGARSVAEYVAAQLKTMNTGIEEFLK